jgi:SpoVK/Ycf46/Vps4 family AAA+-type ATPase
MATKVATEQKLDIGGEQRLLIQRRGQIKARLTRFQKYFQEFDPDTGLTQIKLRLTKLDDSWSEYEEVQSDLELVCEEESQQGDRENFETSHFEIVAAVQPYVLRNVSAGQETHNRLALTR